MTEFFVTSLFDPQPTSLMVVWHGFPDRLSHTQVPLCAV